MDEYPTKIEAALHGLPEGHIGWRIHYFNDTGSTNDIALSLVDAGAKEGEIVVADRQTAGRGRTGHSWDSPGGLNIYLSVVLRPEIAVQSVARVTIMAGVAVARTLSAFSIIRPRLKWPNDVWIDGKKVAGILCENAPFGKCVVGIGINVNAMAADLSESVRDMATSLKAINWETVDRVAVLKRLCVELNDWYRRFVEEGFGKIQTAHDEMSVLNGKRVAVDLNGTVISGITRGIGDDGSLMVCDDRGVLHHVIAGDVALAQSPE